MPLFLDRWLTKTITGALDLDRWLLGRMTDALDDVVLPAVDRTARRAVRLLTSVHRRRRR